MCRLGRHHTQSREARAAAGSCGAPCDEARDEARVAASCWAVKWRYGPSAAHPGHSSPVTAARAVTMPVAVTPLFRVRAPSTRVLPKFAVPSALAAPVCRVEAGQHWVSWDEQAGTSSAPPAQAAPPKWALRDNAPHAEQVLACRQAAHPSRQPTRAAPHRQGVGVAHATDVDALGAGGDGLGVGVDHNPVGAADNEQLACTAGGSGQVGIRIIDTR